MREPRAFEVIEHVWIPMPDDTRLSARLWLPERQPLEQVPVVLEYLPYRKRDGYRSVDDAWGAVLAGAGIAFARVDVRGTGDSEGTIVDEYSERELVDGEVCIAWLAARDWSNGRVGMRGISWGGINTLMIAARRPPALKAIVPMAATDNRFADDAHYLGGLIGKPNLDWGVLFKTVLAGPPDPAIVGDGWRAQWQARLEATPDVITEWLRHETLDSYWQRDSVAVGWTGIQCPVYMAAGWHDTYLNFIGRLLSRLEVPVRALIGPWGHTYPGMARPKSVDWQSEEIRWWRQWLLCEDTGIDLEPRLNVFVPEKTPRQCASEAVPGRWVALEEWPGPSGSQVQYYLQEGRLDLQRPEMPAAEALTYQPTEPVGFTKAEWLDRLPEEQSRDDAHSLCFETEPLAADLEILGQPQVQFRLAAATEECKLAVRLLDVAPDGRSWLVSYAVFDLAFREGFEQRVAVVPGESVALKLPLFLTAHKFRPGHRLRLAVSAALWPMTWPARVATEFTLFTAECSLQLPLLPKGTETTEPAWVVRMREGRATPESLPVVTREQDGGYRYEIIQEPYRYKVPGSDTTLAGEGSFEAVLGPARESRWHQQVRREWLREDWHCVVEAACSIERVPEGLQIRESLRAYQSGDLIFERRHEAVL